MENKWWEYYAVRYFVGTVVGAVVIAYLNSQCDSPFKGSLSSFGELKDSASAFLGVGLIAALGFAFCYVASAPVLTMHATRAHLRYSTIKSHPYIHAATIAPSIGAISWCACQILPLPAAAAIGLILGSQIGLVLVSIFTGFQHIDSFYRTLAKHRAIENTNKDAPATAGLEYVTSYRHLREHGNAMAIVVLEGVLAYVLLQLPSAKYAFFLIAAWLLPATTAWVVGTVLESRFVSNVVTADKQSTAPGTTP